MHIIAQKGPIMRLNCKLFSLSKLHLDWTIQKLHKSQHCWMSWPALDKGNLLQPSSASTRERGNSWPGLWLLCHLRRLTWVAAETMRLSTHSQGENTAQNIHSNSQKLCLKLRKNWNGAKKNSAVKVFFKKSAKTYKKFNLGWWFLCNYSCRFYTPVIFNFPKKYLVWCSMCIM